ncbi:MAG TPA: hypothetical protein VFM21_07350, partial [Terriglobia bacterium]|nr:hypothetical protein [Terriglobia bacterium]
MLKLGRHRTTIAIAAAVAGILLTAGAPRALADSCSSSTTIVLDLTDLHGVTGPFVNVLVCLGADTSSAAGIQATTATFTFTSLTQGGDTYLMGDGASLAINTNGNISLVPNSITWTGGNNDGIGADTGFSSTGSRNVNGFGNFNFSLKDNGGFAEAVTSITFTIQKTSGTWASASSVLATNNKGDLAAAHIFPSAFKGTCTGYVTDGGTKSGTTWTSS